MADYWCTSNDLLCVLLPDSFWTLIMFLLEFFHLEERILPKRHIEPYIINICTLCDNKNTWQIDHCYVLTIAGLVSMFPFSFCPDCGFYRHFCHLEGKSPQNTYLVVCSVSDSKTPWDGSFIWSNKNRLCTFFLAVFGQLSWPLQTFLSFGRKMAPNTHI